MVPNRFVLPEPVGKLLSLLPVYPGSLLFATGLNLVLKSNLPEDVQQALSGKKLRIKVTDARLSFDFLWSNGRFAAGSNQGEPDLTISASAHDFLLLARREEDPDTLFFSRRLSMEGDTELGLLVKNTLDAIELPVFELGKLAPARVFGRIKPGAGGGQS
ncbi:MAG TPA: SCP2 sterol-binding domain-containing protein [Noviherbaspirillum sp.]|uniref:ubiquinone anaerobic biosynthesis accessory factor UbiT n=1 Tax=Noviherbaspirillum sp. TaxID=1926288 RepID=UPI002D73B511|nr:SCP2 sterol-binding domain-containing protein [Noviherbaspirillum sp.]HYD95797.1 SCP2 sterol-binding domain-containing protein [Noviherbaspirillum sp.]